MENELERTYEDQDLIFQDDFEENGERGILLSVKSDGKDTLFAPRYIIETSNYCFSFLIWIPNFNDL